ncbi:MAG: F-box protein [Alphaproteobacteria bacterium]|nr:F-box protein [Alphaproteobacteria bacterium]
MEENFIKINRIFSLLESCPDKILCLMISKLDPLSLLALSQTCTKFRLLLDDEFWEKYNRENNYDELHGDIFYWVTKIFSTYKPSPTKKSLADYFYRVE